MFPWMNPWFYAFKAPWSGNVDQNISPKTSWFSPDIEFNFAGSKAIESEIVAEVASYGKQLGILTDAVFELAEGKKGQAVKDLELLSKQIEDVKARHRDDLSAKARLMLDELKKEEPKVLQAIIKEYSD